MNGTYVEKNFVNQNCFSPYFCQTETATKHVSGLHKRMSKTSGCNSLMVLNPSLNHKFLNQNQILEHHGFLFELFVTAQYMKFCSCGIYSRIYCNQGSNTCKHICHATLLQRKIAGVSFTMQIMLWLANVMFCYTLEY